MKNKSDFLEFALSIAKSAGKLQLSYFGNISKPKSKSSTIDLVTKADTESEKHIIDNIEQEYPDHSIISEEYGQTIKDDTYTWIIDPLDGTTNFVRNLPIFAVSIALLKYNRVICGVVYNPAANKCFYAEKNKGSYLNDIEIRTTSCSTLSDSLLATGFPYIRDDRFIKSFDIFKDFYQSTRGIRRLGSAALDLCFTAMGRFDGFYEYELKTWDICAGLLIVKEAGGLVSDWDGSKYSLSGKRILASNGLIHKEMIEVLTKKEYNLFF